MLEVKPEGHCINHNLPLRSSKGCVSAIVGKQILIFYPCLSSFSNSCKVFFSTARLWRGLKLGLFRRLSSAISSEYSYTSPTLLHISWKEKMNGIIFFFMAKPTVTRFLIINSSPLDEDGCNGQYEMMNEKKRQDEYSICIKLNQID